MDELKFLQIILILFETRSFRQAAARLHVSQPALTKTIQNAEASYGVKLFDRSRAGVAPTPFGEIVAERARLLLQDAGALSRDIRTMAQLEGGGLHLGLGPYMAEALKTKTIGALPRSSLREAFGRRELVELPFRPPAPSTTCGGVYLKNRMLPPAAEVMIK